MKALLFVVFFLLPQTALLHGVDPTAPVISLCEEELRSFEDISCCYREKGDAQKCLDQAMESYAQGETEVSDLLTEFEEARVNNAIVERHCHEIVHAIGRYSRWKNESLALAFDECDHNCHSGCYHGVLETLFFTQEELQSGLHHLTFEKLLEKVPTACSPEKFENPSRSLIFQCQHGMGHAIMFSLDYDLSHALKGCDLLDSAYGRSSGSINIFEESLGAADSINTPM